MRYLTDAKDPIQDLTSLKYDVFISAYNASDRVQHVHSKIAANRCFWWILPEYGYSEGEVSSLKNAIYLRDMREDDLVKVGLDQVLSDLKIGARLLIDITGFMRNQILYIMWYLKINSVTTFDMLYTEPEHYSRKADTTFSQKVAAVRQVAGFEGTHLLSTANDVLLLGVGYDHIPMGRVILHKENARLIQLHSLPSLSADMYHESLLRLDRVSSVTGRPNEGSVYFASASDPYVTATTLSEAYHQLNNRRTISNLYLCPLATKAQAVGFGLFYLAELQGSSSSIILPEIESYSRETSSGVGRSWLYPINLDP